MNSIKSSKANYKNKNNTQHQKKTKPKCCSTKGVMNHIRGIPPSPIWGNKYTAILLDSNLFYISNYNIINIDLVNKEFYQIISSSNLDSNEKISTITKINQNFFLVVFSNDKFLFFQKYSNITNSNDKRIYYKECTGSKRIFQFSEMITSKIKTIFNYESEQLLISGDSQGSIHILKYSFHTDDKNDYTITNTNIDLNYIFSFSLFSVTDIIHFKKFNLFLFSTSNGEIHKFQNFKQNFVSQGIINSSEKVEKHIMSMESLEINEESYLLSVIDKNGTLSIYRISQNYKEPSLPEPVGIKNIFTDKNKFNNKSLDEKYLYFSLKFLSCENMITLLISSNLGKVYSLTFTIDDVINSNLKNLLYKELTDNPHTMAIYNFINFSQDKFLMISADNNISIFKNDLSFIWSLKTMGTVPKKILFNKKNLFIFTESNAICQYQFAKVTNGLFTSTRKLKNENDFSIVKQANFDENIFSILWTGESTKIKEIEIYYFLSDLKLAKINFLEEILDIAFYPSKSTWGEKRNLICNEYENKDVIFSLFSDFSLEDRYDNLYILDTSGVLTIWDFITGGKNKVQLFDNINQNNILQGNIFKFSNTSSHLKEFLFSPLEISNNSDKNRKFKIYFFNQLICQEKFIHSFTDDESNYHANYICDHFLSNNQSDLFFMTSFSQSNFLDLMIIHYKFKFPSEMLNISHFDFINYKKCFNNLSEIVPINLTLHNITNSSIKHLVINKSPNPSSDNNLIEVRFLICGNDNVIKVLI